MDAWDTFYVDLKNEPIYQPENSWQILYRTDQISQWR